MSEENKQSFHEAKNLLEKRINDYNLNQHQDHVSKFEMSIDRTSFSINSDEEAKIQFVFSEGIQYGDLIHKACNMYSGLVLEDGFSAGTTRLKNDDITIDISKSQYGYGISASNVIIKKRKDTRFSSSELEGIVEMYSMANPLVSVKKADPVGELRGLGAIVYDNNEGFDWSCMAGYESVKEEIKNTIILPYENPQLYERVARLTRKKFESIKPNAVLFEGPPGTSKTTAGKIIANECSRPLVYVPVESILSKWYGESETRLASIFDCANSLESLIFIDEIDSLAGSREGGKSSEVSNRVLGTLLRKIDGFDSSNDSILIGATNRKNDLDPALLSRFDTSIHFPLPDESTRNGIFELYAKHLDLSDIKKLASESEGFSGRNIKDICEHAERTQISKVLAGEISDNDENLVPSVDEYLKSVSLRKKSGI